MKIKNLSFGVDISDIQLSGCSDSQLKDIIDICIKERLVVLKNQEMSSERFDEISEIFGIHQPDNIWASHANFPKIIRVTNKEVSKGKKGFFHHKEGVHWHCDRIFSPDPEDCTGFWCIEPGKAGGSTEFACGVQAYNNLDDTIKAEIENANIILTNDFPKTYMKKGIYKIPLTNEQTYVDKMHIKNNSPSINSERVGKIIWKNKIITKETTLVIKHRVTGTIGLFFPVYGISQITGLKTPSRAKDIFYILMNSYVGEKGKIYKHHWQKGDLILSDQTHSLHRRNTYKGIRELYRIVFWYHNSNTKNTKRVVQ